jgi:type II secretory pathway pseudopilin PulG
MNAVNKKNAGYSLIELVVSSALLSLLILTLITLATNGSDAQEYARRLNRVTEITHELVDQIRVEMVSWGRVFGTDAEGTANLALIDLTSAPTPLATTRLPTVSPGESIRVDAVGTEITGNSLFFARLAWTDRYACAGGNEYLVDVYRWVYYYLTPEDGGPSPGNPIGLNVVRIESEPLVDAASIDRITDPTDQRELLLHLHDGTPDALGVRHAPCEVVWARGQLPSVTGTLRMIDAGDGSLSDTPIGSRSSPWSVVRSEQSVRGLLTYRHHSIATNFSPSNYGVGRYSVSTTSGAGYPHGFEVQIVGPSSARQTLLHLVVSSTNRRGHWAWADVQMVIDSRDL